MLLWGWMALLLVESFCNDTLSLVVVGGSISASSPLALVLAYALGSSTFHAVLVFCLFVLVLITLDLVELCLR
jgi:hypothetical protein